MKKRLMVICMAIFMILTLVPSDLIIAKAEETTEIEYKKIYTIADLAAIENDMSGHYMLMNDIDMSETKKGGSWDSGYGWVPLGYNKKEEFSGVLDGNGYSLIGMNCFDQRCGGLIYTVSGTVKNIRIKKCDIKEVYCAGGIASKLNGGTIMRCSSENGIIEQKNNLGYNLYYGAGGIVGQSNIGEGVIAECFNTSTLSTYGRLGAVIGGIIGSGNKINIVDCYNAGDIEGKDDCSSICGIGMEGNLKNCYNVGKLKQFTSNGSAHACGYAYNEENCYYDVNCYVNGGYDNDATSKSTEQLSYQATFAGWDFDNTWIIDSATNYKYPQLRNNRQDTDKNVETIEWSSLPSRQTYYKGAAIDLSGAEITVYYVDDTSETIKVTKDMLSEYDMSKVGTQQVTVIYKDKTLTFDITVKEILNVDQISGPDKTEFVKGTAFDFTGWQVRVIYTDGKTETIDVTPEMATGANINVVGSYTVKYELNGQVFEQEIKVTPIKLSGIKITKKPTKLTYIEGEEFDSTGMVVEAAYNNGTSKEITDYTVEGFESELGTHTIIVKYQNYSDEFDVEVEKGVPVAIAVTTMPDKTEYIEGQAFDSTGMVVQAVYSNGFKKTITDYTVSAIPSGLGSRKVTISSGNVSTYIYVKVKEKELESIVVDTLPEKTLYVEGEKFDKNGIVVKAIYNNGNSEEISDYVLSGVDMSQIGTHQITVSYQGLMTTFDIEVIGKSLKSISAIGVKKTEYMPGEKLDLAGLVVKAIYNNGTSSELSADDYSVSGYTGTVGNNIISVSYGGKSATFVVVVHNPSGEWVVTKEATCTSEGEKVQYCKDCDKELYREKIEKKAHTLVKDAAVDATCTTPGKTEGTHCSACGEVIVKQDEIPALGHSFGDWEIVSKATCENAGELKRVCSVCGAEETKKDPATGHDYMSSIVKATCTKGGYTQHVCSRCGDSYKDSFTLPVEHSYVSQVTKSATCMAEGVKTYICTNCGDTYTEIIKMLPHTVVIDAAQSASCTKTGLTEGKHCSVCGTVIETQKTIPKKAHTYKVVTTPATTVKNGSKVKKCSSCGAVATKRVIYRPATVTLSKNSFVYSGKVQRPSIAVKDSKGRIIPSTGYTMTYSKGCRAVGKYALKLTFKGNYRGTVNRTFTIVPKSTLISSVRPSKKTFTVSWKKQTVESNGYEVQYAVTSNFRGAKTVAVTSNKITSRKITAVTSKRKYYVRVRTYKKTGNKKYYSTWSGVKTVVVK